MKLAERPAKSFYNRFSIDKLAKYTKRNYRTLPELISRYPGYGLHFKVFHTLWKNRYYVVEDIEYKDHRHCSILGIKYFKDHIDSKVVKLRNILKKGLWGYSIPNREYTTENGVVYNLSKMENMIEEKKKMLKERNNLLGKVDYWKMKAAELKKKKAEDKKKKR